MENEVEFRRIRNSGEIISDSFSFIVSNFSSLYKVLLFTAGPFYLGSLLFTGFFKAELGDFVLGPGLNLPFSGFYKMIFSGAVMGAFAGFFYFSGVYQFIASFSENAGKVTISDIWSRIRSSAWLFIKTFIGLCAFGVLLVFVFGIGAAIILALTGAFVAATGFIGGVVGVAAIYVLLFGLIMPLSLIFNVRLYEQKKFFASVSQSYKLASANWKKSFLVVLVFFGLQFLFGIISSAPEILTDFAELGGFMIEHGRTIRILSTFLSGILGFIMGAITLVAINFLYFSLSEEKDATGLMERIADIGTSEQETSL